MLATRSRAVRPVEEWVIATRLRDWMRRYVWRHLATGSCSLAEAAARLAMGERTVVELLEAWCSSCGATEELALVEALQPAGIWLCARCRAAQLGFDQPIDPEA